MNADDPGAGRDQVDSPFYREDAGVPPKQGRELVIAISWAMVHKLACWFRRMKERGT